MTTAEKNVRMHMEEEFQKVSKECDVLINELEKTYTQEQIELMEKLDNLINYFYYIKAKINKFYTKASKPNKYNLEQKGKHYPKVYEELRQKYPRITYEELKQKYPKAGQKWTGNENNELRNEYNNGKSISELSIIFQRTPFAIHLRLIKLGLIAEEI